MNNEFESEKARPGGQHGSLAISGTLKNLRIFNRRPAGLCQFAQNGTETGRNIGTPLTRDDPLFVHEPSPWFKRLGRRA